MARSATKKKSSAKTGRSRFHGAVDRFEVMATFIYERYGSSVNYIADVAGGQGMLSRILRKKYNYEAEVVDPRGWTLRGVPNRAEEFDPALASYYDLIVGLHPDQATRAVAEARWSSRSSLSRAAIFGPRRSWGVMNWSRPLPSSTGRTMSGLSGRSSTSRGRKTSVWFRSRLHQIERQRRDTKSCVSAGLKRM